MEKAFIAVIGVFLGALLTVVRELFNDHRLKKKKAEYAAVRVSFILEQFISGCVAVVGDDGDMYGRDEQGCLQLQTTKPEVEFLSLEVEWQSLPFETMYQILNFPSLVNEANGKIESVFEHVAFPPDYDEGIEERQYQYAKLGLIAHEIAESLRSRYRMPQKEYENWSPIEYLQTEKKKIDDIREQREKRHRPIPNA